jgi:hypothetical protein
VSEVASIRSNSSLRIVTDTRPSFVERTLANMGVPDLGPQFANVARWHFSDLRGRADDVR